MPSYATTDSVSRGNRRARVLGAGAAQDPPPRIGPVVVDLRGILPRFPTRSRSLKAALDQTRSRAAVALTPRACVPVEDWHGHDRSRWPDDSGAIACQPGDSHSGRDHALHAFASALSLNFGDRRRMELYQCGDRLVAVVGRAGRSEPQAPGPDLGENVQLRGGALGSRSRISRFTSTCVSMRSIRDRPRSVARKSSCQSADHRCGRVDK